MPATQLQTFGDSPIGNNATGAQLFYQPKCYAVDAGNTTDTGYVANVVATLNILTGAPVLSGTTTKACVAGVATFIDLVVTGAGTYTLTFSSGALTPKTSGTLITWATTKFTVTVQPGSIPAGAGASYPYTAMVVQAQTAASVLDTAFGGAAASTQNDPATVHCLLTLTTPAGAVLSGPDRLWFFAGVATARGIAVSLPGTYAYTITAQTSSGIAGTVSGSFTVSAAVDTFFNPTDADGVPKMQGLGAALPRTVPATTRPAVGTIRFVGPTETYTTIQSAITAAASAGGAQTIKLRAGQTLSEETSLPALSGGTTSVTITTDGWSKTLGERVAPSDFTGRAIWQNVVNNGNLWQAAGPGVNNYWLVGLNCRTNSAVGQCSSLATLGMDDGQASANPTAAAVSSGLYIDQCYMHHDEPTATRTCNRAIRWRAKNSGIINSYFAGFQNTSNPDAQSILCDNTPGNLLLDNNYIEGESEGFMIGGATFYAAELVPFDVTITRNYWTKPFAQLALWKPKNLLEFKAGHRIKVSGNIFDGFWDANVSQWSCIVAKSVNQDTGPAQAYIGTSDVSVFNNFFRNVPDLFQLNGGPQGPVEMMSRLAFHNNLACNVNSTTWSTGAQGDGNIGHFASFFDVVVDHLTVVSAPRATLLRSLKLGGVDNPTRRATYTNILLVSDLGNAQAVVLNNGTWSFNGLSGATGDPLVVVTNNHFASLDTAGTVTYNTTNAPASNTFAAVDGLGDIANPGFTNFGIRSTAASADPLTICDAFVLTSGVPKGAGTGATDIGVKNMSSLKTAITGVMLGVYAGNGIMTGLVILTAAAGAIGSVPLTTQPVIRAVDANGNTVTSFTGPVTVYIRVGRSRLRGTLTVNAVAGVATFTNLVLTGRYVNDLGYSTPSI